jgi:hypothetical protein
MHFHQIPFELIALILVAMAGCATIQPAPTASGRPEIFVSAAPSKVRSTLVAACARAGSRIDSQTDSQVTVSRRLDNLGSQLIYGSRYDSIPNALYIYTLIPEAAGTRVFVQGEVVTNPGSAFERRTPIEQADPKALPAMQGNLERLAALAAQ